MKLRYVACTQFAGIRDKRVDFADGINVVYGKNESGKSTLVNLLSRTLFQNARLDGRSDREFRELYFPGARRGGAVAGDFADGTVSFETANGHYTLQKEWGTDSRCILSTPDGVIRDQVTIDRLLKEALLYGEGVYAEMLFSSQRNTDAALQTILDATRKTDAKQELTDAVSQAFAESDGISVDAIEQAINAKIDEIAGKHWDLERHAPVRKAGRWAVGLGEILKAYYALEDARAVLMEISQLENEADRTAADYAVRDNAATAAEQAYNRFSTFSGQLAVQSERRKTITRIDAERQKLAEVLAKWPRYSESLQTARALQTERSNRALLDTYAAAKRIADELQAVDTTLPCPTEQEISQVRNAERRLAVLQNALCGMNIRAAIRMLGEHQVVVTSLRSGDVIDVTDGTATITEAVSISVPGVMELQLSPANVNVAEVEAEIAGQKAAAAAILGHYKVSSLDELETLARRVADAKRQAEIANNRLALLLGDTTFEQLKAAVSGIPATLRTKQELDREILTACGTADVARFITARETIVDGYAAEYGSIDGLKARITALEAERQAAESSLAAVTDIPEEYRAVADPERHLENLKVEMQARRRYREEALSAKTAAASRLESYKQNVPGDPAADAEKAERRFNEQQSLLAHWLHIAEVFKAQKANIHDNPMQDIADRFAQYLSMLSGGTVSSEFPQPDKLDMHIYSDNRLLDYGKLSEGTKETVSLAFRLAVLDHLFPEGGGVIVLDDPSADMDAERTAQACTLVAECATRHQVIFLTCHEHYLPMLAGNLIRI